MAASTPAASFDTSVPSSGNSAVSVMAVNQPSR